MKVNISEQVAKVEKKVADLRVKLSIQEGILSYLKQLENPNSQPVIRSRRRNGDSLNSQVVALMKETGRAMEVSDIAKKLEIKGVTTKSKYGLAPMIASSLRKDEKTFVRLKRGVYCLKEQENDNKQPLLE